MENEEENQSSFEQDPDEYCSKLRQRKPNFSIMDYIKQRTHDDFFNEDEDQGQQTKRKRKKKKKIKIKKIKEKKVKVPKPQKPKSVSSESANDSEFKDEFQSQPVESSGESYDQIMDKLPKNKKQLEKVLEKVNQKMLQYQQQFYQETYENISKKSKIEDNSIPICEDVTQLDFDKLIKCQLEFGGRLFDAIMMDPPWQLSSSQPSRGVAITYESLSDDKIKQMPIQKLQTDGFIFIWAINAKYRFTCQLIEDWGYKLVDEITWVKKTVNGKMAKGHGFYLQHAKESCLVGIKGNIDHNRFKKNLRSDIIFSERRGQSQKPEEIYQYIEALIPNGFYLEIFGRRNNLRNNWVTIGNEL